MSEYVHLIGADDVNRAGRNMQHAAEQMSRAAESIEYSNERQRIFMDDWLSRYEELLKQHENA